VLLSHREVDPTADGVVTVVTSGSVGRFGAGGGQYSTPLSR
jgi:hypothetical protein